MRILYLKNIGLPAVRLQVVSNQLPSSMVEIFLDHSLHLLRLKHTLATALWLNTTGQQLPATIAATPPWYQSTD